MIGIVGFAGQFDQQITHDHSIMGKANDKSYDATHDNLEDDTHHTVGGTNPPIVPIADKASPY